MSSVVGTVKEQRLLRALAHAVRRNHDLTPAGCHGCREVAAVLAVPGYDGDESYPPCIGVLGTDSLTKLGQMKDNQIGAAR